MEEFYRKKYLSPTYTRMTGYLDSLEKDKAISQLRKELIETKAIEQRFDELCIEIARLECENKKIESEHSNIEAEYLQKIKKNKTKITELKQNILGIKGGLQEKNGKVAELEGKASKMTQEMEKDRKQIEKKHILREEYTNKIAEQEKLLKEIEKKTDEERIKSIQLRKENEIQSENLSKQLTGIQEKQSKSIEIDGINAKLKVELELLLKEKRQWESKNELSKSQLSNLSLQLESQEREKQDLEDKMKQIDSFCQNERNNWNLCEQNLKYILNKCKENSLQLKTEQANFIEKQKKCQESSRQLEQSKSKERQLKKINEHYETIIKEMSEILRDEEQNYNKIVQHMRTSIQEDQKAIKSLTIQANLLEHMIS